MKKVILLVAFEDPLRTDLVQQLTEWEYSVAETLSIGNTYVWLENNEPPYCIICDNYRVAINEAQRNVNTENRMDGYKFLLELNNNPRYNTLRFGIIGAYDDHPYSWGLAKPMLPTQLCFWLFKPFYSVELKDGIETCSGSTPYGNAPQQAWKSNSPRLKFWKDFSQDE